MPKLYAGTSGFAYPKWKPYFYPQKLASKGFLQHYAARLNAVEINYTFRQLPKAATLEAWVNATPAEFRFACKAHMRITHINRLRESEFNELFFKTLEPLRASKRLGPVLFQLPPNFKLDLALLTAFVEKLPTDVLTTFEFRNTSWLTDAVYALLEKHRVALCLAESDKLEIPRVITADFVYARLRKENYTAEELADVATRTKEQLAEGRDVYLFFKHEDDPTGALHAEGLMGKI